MIDSWWFWGALMGACLWAAYFHLKNKSKEIGLPEHHPFQRTTFYAIMAYTVIQILAVLLTILNAWLEHVRG